MGLKHQPSELAQRRIEHLLVFQREVAAGHPWLAFLVVHTALMVADAYTGGPYRTAWRAFHRAILDTWIKLRVKFLPYRWEP